LKGAGDVFFIETGDYTGELYDAVIAIEVDVFENAGVGLGYNYADLNLGASRSEGDADLDVSYDGILAYLKLGF
jgi:hypothetical protein